MKKIETIKNIALIVLFFTTMLFLYHFWDNPIDRSLNLASLIGREEIEIPSFEAVTVPRQVILNSGEGTFSIIEENKSEKWNLILAALDDESNTIETINEITENQYDLIMEYRSLALRFNYAVPVEALHKKYDVADNPVFEQLGGIDIIAYSSGSPESLFTYNKSKDKYYRIVFKNIHAGLDGELRETALRTNYDYYKIGHVIGTANETVVPVSGVFSTEEIEYLPEFGNVDDEVKKEFAKSFFGESLDFVRQIKGSKGSLTFMYGYGEKILSISSKGKVDYKNNETPQGLQQNYIEALESALEFVAYHGGWKSGKGIEMKPYVRRVDQIESNKDKGYRIIFGMDFGKDSLYLKEGCSLAVEIINGEVIRYQRDVIIIDEDYYYAGAFVNEQEIYSIVNAIASNYIDIGKALQEKGINLEGLKGEEIFIAISEKINYAKSAYMQENKDDESSRLKPVWAVSMDDAYIYFDLFTGEFLGTSDY